MSASEFAGVVHDKRFTLEVLCLQNALIHVQLDLFDLSILPKQLSKRKV